MWLPVRNHWRLNERHYGALQGLNKEETAQQAGPEQVHLWRRSFDVPPPALDSNDERHPRFDPRYTSLSPDELPATESLRATIARVLPYWQSAIVPELKQGKRVLIAAHGNSLRGLVKHLDQIADEDIPGVEIPTGKPLVYELDGELQVVERYYLEDKVG
jgi:2,3-bisphosphoglycerate-dependent phosphoglycerate mutase